MWRLICLALVAVVLQCGCVTVDAPPVPSQAVRDSFGVVAVVPAQYPPQSNFLISWRHKEGATGKQALLTAGAMGASTAAMYTPVLGPFGVLAGVLTTGVMTVQQAVSTSHGIVPAGTAAEIESSISKALAALEVQKALAARLETTITSDPRIRLANPGTTGIDTVLEVAITEIGFEGCITHNWDCRPPHLVHLFMRAQARLVRVADGAVLFERPLEHKSGKRALASWLADGGRSLGEEFEQAYRALAETIFDEAFLIAPIALPYVTNLWETRCWLEPVEERQRFHGYRFDALQPTLRWTAFPREIDRRELDPAILQKIVNVTYDLRVWDEAAEARGGPFSERWRNRLVYEHAGLAGPQHTLEVPLAPDSRYYWTVRARFVVDGRPMATRWARWNGCFSDQLFLGYYEFDTPK